MNTKDVGRTVQHKPTMPPFECLHCGLVFYGWYASDKEVDIMGETEPLCTRCHNACWNYRYDRPEGDEHAFKLAWIADSEKQPKRLSDARRFHRSVPPWMRSAIRAGHVKSNGEEVYIISSQNNACVNVELSDSTKLRPWRGFR